MSKCESSEDGFRCACIPINFIGWQKRQKIEKSLETRDALGDPKNPLCLPVNNFSKSEILLKSAKNKEEEFFPYGVIYEFFKTQFGEKILPRESRRPERLEHLFDRQIHLMDSVMRPNHRIWRNCKLQCRNTVCSLEELRTYHDR